MPPAAYWTWASPAGVLRVKEGTSGYFDHFEDFALFQERLLVASTCISRARQALRVLVPPFPPGPSSQLIGFAANTSSGLLSDRH